MFGRRKDHTEEECLCGVCGGRMRQRCEYCGDSPEMREVAAGVAIEKEKELLRRGTIVWGSTAGEYKRFALRVTTRCPCCDHTNTEAHALWPSGPGYMGILPFVVFCGNADCSCSCAKGALHERTPGVIGPGYGILIAFYDGNQRGVCRMDTLYTRICQHPRWGGASLAEGVSQPTTAERTTEIMAAGGDVRNAVA